MPPALLLASAIVAVGEKALPTGEKISSLTLRCIRTADSGRCFCCSSSSSSPSVARFFRWGVYPLRDSGDITSRPRCCCFLDERIDSITLATLATLAPPTVTSSQMLSSPSLSLLELLAPSPLLLLASLIIFMSDICRSLPRSIILPIYVFCKEHSADTARHNMVDRRRVISNVSVLLGSEVRTNASALISSLEIPTVAKVCSQRFNGEALSVLASLTLFADSSMPYNSLTTSRMARATQTSPKSQPLIPSSPEITITSAR
mmetsp:Transcript_15921/g.34584  ORF Transcript_15921/g.34584 Transcript_15921/m.34584 type:complete len:261 (-) Transcript_15921:253-1035(-)